MNMRFTFTVAAAALAISGPVAAHGTRHYMSHASAKSSMTMHSDENIIDRCSDKRYDAKVACLREARGEQWNAAGSTSGAAASGMTGGSVKAHPVR